MTFRLRHEWEHGATLPALAGGVVVIGAMLATCPHCETLRVTEPSRVTFIQRKLPEAERVRELEPPCIGAAPFFKAPW